VFARGFCDGWFGLQLATAGLPSSVTSAAEMSSALHPNA
jgi:hypothetical protein